MVLWGVTDYSGLHSHQLVNKSKDLCNFLAKWLGGNGDCLQYLIIKKLEAFFTLFLQPNLNVVVRALESERNTAQCSFPLETAIARKCYFVSIGLMIADMMLMDNTKGAISLLFTALKLTSLHCIQSHQPEKFLLCTQAPNFPFACIWNCSSWIINTCWQSAMRADDFNQSFHFLAFHLYICLAVFCKALTPSDNLIPAWNVLYMSCVQFDIPSSNASSVPLPGVKGSGEMQRQNN